MSRRGWLVALLAVVLSAVLPIAARADGDPGSDVLVYQDLFAGTAAGLSITQQTELGALLKQADSDGFPVRMAIIGGSTDLGSVTALWRQPQSYAKFLGIELSLAYRHPLLVVMPNGIGVNWPGHTRAATAVDAELAKSPIAAGPSGLVAGAEHALRVLAADGRVQLRGRASGSAPGGQVSTAANASPTAAAARSAQPTILSTGSSAGAAGRAKDTRAAVIVLVLFLLAGAVLGARRYRRRGRAKVHRNARAPAAQHRVLIAVAGVSAIVVVALVAVLPLDGGVSTARTSVLASNPVLDPGTTLAGRAPGFTLSDESGRPVSLHSYRGKVVILAFNDSECTTICPITTTAMLDAKAMLGSAGSRVQLLGVEANPHAISLEDVASYTRLHGLLGRWHFLTGTLPALTRVWRAYNIQADVQRGLIAHTPALFIISPDGREAKVYVTQQSYSAVGQLGQILAHETASLLPGHPAVNSRLSYAPVPAIGPTDTVSLPQSGGGHVVLGPGRAHLQVFFATWDQEVTSLAGHLSALDRYAAAAQRAGLPPLTAVDEGSVEPSPTTLAYFLHGLGRPLSYPVAVDGTGRLADGYEVQGQPWFVLTSASGQIIWYREVDTQGWPSPTALITTVRAALARAPHGVTSLAAAQRQLAGSPPALAALHRRASRLLGDDRALSAQIRALRGYPIVLNVWESYCGPCQAEFGLFANASASYGRRVAFIGADANDSAGDARSFLHQHPVSYPSYQVQSTQLSPLAVLAGFPTTIFISPEGKAIHVQSGEYLSQGTLNQDIESLALRR